MLSGQLDAWYLDVARAQLNNSAELQVQFESASIISSDRVVFNIKGNDYRLVVSIEYRFQSVFVLWLGTHQEYDKIGAKKVTYDKRRYADTPRSQ